MGKKWPNHIRASLQVVSAIKMAEADFDTHNPAGGGGGSAPAV